MSKPNDIRHVIPIRREEERYQSCLDGTVRELEGTIEFLTSACLSMAVLHGIWRDKKQFYLSRTIAGPVPDEFVACKDLKVRALSELALHIRDVIARLTGGGQ